MPIHPDKTFTGGKVLRRIDQWLFSNHQREGGWRNFLWGHAHGAEHLRRARKTWDRDEFGRAMDHFRQAWNGNGRVGADPTHGRGDDAYGARGGYVGDVQRHYEHLGGVDLDVDVNVDDAAAANIEAMMFSLHTLHGVRIEQDRIVLFGQDGAMGGVGLNGSGEINQDDLLLVLLLVFSGFEPSFSLDPWDSSNPDGPHYQKVFYPDALAGTALGKTLFDTDYLMKSLALGELSVPGLSSEGAIALADAALNGSGVDRARLWISADDVPVSVVGGEVQFGAVKMVCSARRLVLDPTSPSGLKDAALENRDNSSGQRFATQFTAQYEEIARVRPEFERLRNLAKLVAFAKFLRNANVNVDVNVLRSLLLARGIRVLQGLTVSGPRAPDANRPVDEHGVPRLTKSHSKTEGQDMRTITLSGGVVLAPGFSVVKQDLLRRDIQASGSKSVSIPLSVMRSPLTHYGNDSFARAMTWNGLGIFAPRSWSPVDGVPTGEKDCWKGFLLSSQLPSNPDAIGQVTMSVVELLSSPDFSGLQAVSSLNNGNHEEKMEAMSQAFLGAVPAMVEKMGRVQVIRIGMWSQKGIFACVTARVVHGFENADLWLEHQIWLRLDSKDGKGSSSCLGISICGRYSNEPDIGTCGTRVQEELLSSLQSQFQEDSALDFALAQSRSDFEQQTRKNQNFGDDQLERAIALSRAEHDRHNAVSQLDAHLERALALSCAENSQQSDSELQRALALSQITCNIDNNDDDAQLQRALALSLYDGHSVPKRSSSIHDDDELSIALAISLSDQDAPPPQSPFEFADALKQIIGMGLTDSPELRRTIVLVKGNVPNALNNLLHQGQKRISNEKCF